MGSREFREGVHFAFSPKSFGVDGRGMCLRVDFTRLRQDWPQRCFGLTRSTLRLQLYPHSPR